MNNIKNRDPILVDKFAIYPPLSLSDKTRLVAKSQNLFNHGVTESVDISRFFFF